MSKETQSQFNAELLRPEKPGGESEWAFVILPIDVSLKLPRRGRTSVDGKINGVGFQVLLEPDGQKSHWLKVEQELLEAAGVTFGSIAEFDIVAVEQEPEPKVPADFVTALKASPESQAVWDETTTVARIDWIHWITSAKQSKTRVKRISDACSMLASGKKRVCCFDPSGFYSKAIKAPKAVE